MPDVPPDVLQEIPLEDISYFCENVLKRDWPYSIHVYYFIKTMNEWRKKNADVKVSLLTMENNIEDGTFVGILYSELGGCTVIVYTQEEGCHRLARALRSTRRINWSTNPTFEAVLQKHTSTVYKVAAVKGVETNVYAQSSILYTESDTAKRLNISCPPGVYLAPLDSTHIPFIHSVWAHNDITTARELENTVKLNGGFGVFSSNTDDVLSWAMHTHYGGIGVLQTHSDHKCNGYGRLVTQCITRALGQLGISPHVCVMDSNYKSLTLFRSVGYEHVSSIQYITTCASNSHLSCRK